MAKGYIITYPHQITVLSILVNRNLLYRNGSLGDFASNNFCGGIARKTTGTPLELVLDNNFNGKGHSSYSYQLFRWFGV